jgi:hypothetical protein
MHECTDQNHSQKQPTDNFALNNPLHAAKLLIPPGLGKG